MRNTVVGKTFILIMLITLAFCTAWVSGWSFTQTREFFVNGAGEADKALPAELAVIFSIIVQIGPTAMWIIKEMEEEAGNENVAEFMFWTGWVFTIIDAGTNLGAYWMGREAFPNLWGGVFQVIMTIICIGVTQAEEAMAFLIAYALHFYNDIRVMQGKKPRAWMNMASEGFRKAADIRRPAPQPSGGGHDNEHKEYRPPLPPPPPAPQNRGPNPNNQNRPGGPPRPPGKG